jgi:hypothetical protein
LEHAALVGTWILTSAEDLIDGKWVHRYGQNPKGYFSFGKDGHVSVQFMKFPREDESSPSESYLAYFGTYTVDHAKGEITIHIEGSLHPKLVGTTQIRAYRIQNNILFIEGDSFKRTFTKA